VLGGLGLLSLPVASAVAILKYRLYDIDVVINKTIVFGVLAAFITGIYVAIVVGIGTLLGSQDEPNLALSIAATAVVAIAFSPVKERTQRLANRLVYGHRLSPYEVMSDLSRTVATAPTPSDVLKAVAKAATFGVNAGTAAVTLHLHEGGSVSFTFPEGADVSTEERSSWPVSHRGEVLGELAITKQRSDPVTPHDRALLGDLATHAGLALHNARLAFELEARLKEISSQAEKLQSSRARIVSAADDSRRRLERDITQGPRQDLVALSARLDDAKRLMGVDPEAAATLLETITLDTNAALDALRELARGIYPPLLADKGIVAALEAHVSKHDLDVRIEAGEAVRDERFDDHVETTIYFCCIEALRDVQSGCSVWIDKQGERFFVEANPVLLDAKAAAAIEDRIEAIGGRFSFQSDVGEGKARMSIDALALEVA
jgi:signal transduction histidine kinase